MYTIETWTGRSDFVHSFRSGEEVRWVPVARTHTHTNEHRQSHSAQIGRIGTALAWVTSGYFTMFFLFYDPEKKSLGFAFLSGVRDTLPK